MIEFKNVTKKYDNKTTALNDVSLSIDKGEFVFVVGSSGAGKSTFLKLMMREEVPTSGTIIIDGINLNKMRKRNIPKLRRKLGIVFQDFRLIPTMTVFNNVAFAMRVIGTKQKKIRRRVPYLLSLMGLSEKARNYPRELSGGEQQRVALARALANDADIIIADEPTGNVDPQMSYEIVDLLMRLNEAGTTVVMVTHEHELVRHFDKRVIILDKGTVISDGAVFDQDAASGHINPGSEIPSQSSQPVDPVVDEEKPVESSVVYEDIVSDSSFESGEAVTETLEVTEEYQSDESKSPEDAETVEEVIDKDNIPDLEEVIEETAVPIDSIPSELPDPVEVISGDAPEVSGSEAVDEPAPGGETDD